MADSVYDFTEKVERIVGAKGIQINDEMVSALLTDSGKKSSLTKEELSEAELAQVKDVYNMLMVKLIKKADPESTITKKEADTELEEKLKPEVEVAE